MLIAISLIIGVFPPALCIGAAPPFFFAFLTTKEALGES